MISPVDPWSCAALALITPETYRHKTAPVLGHTLAGARSTAVCMSGTSIFRCALSCWGDRTVLCVALSVMDKYADGGAAELVLFGG